MIDAVKRVCEQWISAGYGEDCFWEDWPECPCEDSLTPNQVMAAVAKLEAENQRLRAERDQAVAAAFEYAAKICDSTAKYHVSDPDDIESVRATAAEIRALTPADAQAALEAYGREKMREGMQRAAELVSHSAYGTAYWAILAEMEKLK